MWKDPRTKRLVTKSLDKVGLRNAAARTAWAINRADLLQRELQEIAELELRGVDPFARTSPRRARDAYLASLELEHDRRAATVTAYSASTALLTEWMESVGLQAVQDLAPGQLHDLRDWVITRRRRRPKRGGSRGEFETTDQRRSPDSINHSLRGIRTALFWMWNRDLLLRVEAEHVKRRVNNVGVVPPVPDPILGSRLRALLSAAIRSDTAPEVRVGECAPLLAVAILSGMRRGELAALRWSDVDLAAVGRLEDGTRGAVGCIRLLPTAVKTKKRRVIDMAVTPGLRAVLAAWRLRAGDGEYVFGGKVALTKYQIRALMARLETYGAPEGGTSRRSARRPLRRCTPHHCGRGHDGEGVPADRAQLQGRRESLRPAGTGLRQCGVVARGCARRHRPHLGDRAGARTEARGGGGRVSKPKMRILDCRPSGAPAYVRPRDRGAAGQEQRATTDRARRRTARRRTSRLPRLRGSSQRAARPRTTRRR